MRNNIYGYGFKSLSGSKWSSLNSFQWRKSFSYQPAKSAITLNNYTYKAKEENK